MFSKRKIGKTNLEVSELGLGTAAMAGNHRPVSLVDHQAALKTGLDAGISFLDTAPFYGFTRSEHFAGDALRDRSDWVLSTKAGRLFKPGPAPEHEACEWPGSFPFRQVYDYSYSGVMRSYEDSVQRLGLDRIDILLLHDIGEMQHGAEANKPLQADAMSGGYKALDELRRAGDIKAIGLGVNEKKVCIEALDHGDWDTFLLAGRYTLLEQTSLDDILPMCRAAGTSLIIGGPFNSGILAGGDTWNYAKAPKEVIEHAKKLDSVCQDHKIPLPAAALRFPMGEPLVSSIIPGPRSQQEMQMILDWWEMEIPASLWSDMKQAGLLHESATLPSN
jgi:D-threo-aldose 1-dehydrogenase